MAPKRSKPSGAALQSALLASLVVLLRGNMVSFRRRGRFRGLVSISPLSTHFHEFERFFWDTVGCPSTTC
jgi:uncharacterized protein YigE (DUF2233 family)